MKKQKKVYLLLIILFASLLLLNGCIKNRTEGPKPEPKTFKQEINLYFADKDAMYLLPEKREVTVAENASREEIAKAALTELIKGPENTEYYPTIPEKTQLLSVKLEQDTLYLDFSQELKTEHPGGSAGEILTIMSIVNTAAETAGTEKVQILIEGEKQETLAGHIDIKRPIKQDKSMIRK